MGRLYLLLSRTDLRRLSANVRRNRAICAAMFLCLTALPHAGHAQQPAQPSLQPNLPAAQLPSAPAPQLPSQTAQDAPANAISGSVTDRDGDVIGGARITLTHTSDVEATSRIAISSGDGRFNFPNVPPGPFSLSISADGFAPQQISGVLLMGEIRNFPAIALSSGSTTSVQVTASQSEIAEAQIGQEEKQRVLALFPNFYVSYISNPVPLDPRQKFQLAFRTLIDPVPLLLNGVAAAIEQADNTYAWGQGTQGYAKRYAAGYGNVLTDTLLSNAVFPILFKQDPRYFYKGTGSIHSRILYALANAVVCKGDNHHWQPNYSAILGSLASSGISNLYYPAVNRDGVALTFENTAIGTGLSAAANLIQEFLVRRLTPHIPAHAPTSP
jgi:hypothetical protein